MTVLGILGLDYCGSTMLSNVLSGLPGVVNVGESHWILDRGLGCKECGNSECGIFSTKLISRLTSEDIHGGRWWDIILQETGQEIVVSSDKLPKHYDRFGTPDKLLFLYKDPCANIYSWCKRKFPIAIEEGRKFNQEEVLAGISWWLVVTDRIITWLEGKNAEVACVNLEDFVNNSHEMTKGIAQWIGADFDPMAIKFWKRELHYIGGNHSVKRLKSNRYFYKKITKDLRWKENLSESDIALIVDNEKIRDLIQRANECSNI